MPEIVELPLEEVLALPVYPTADIFPMLLDEGKAPDGHECLTINQLSDELAAVGVRVPLVIWNGFLLDGRNRREAARIANKINPEVLTTLPVRYEHFETEEEADSWVLSLNIDHRILNKDQLACLAVRLWDLEDSRQGSRSDLTSTNKSVEVAGRAKRLALRFHVNHEYVTAARTLWLTDQSKFKLAASGRKKVLSSLVNTGQTTKSDTDPYEAACTRLNTAYNNLRKEGKEVRRLGGVRGDENMRSKMETLNEDFGGIQKADEGLIDTDQNRAYWALVEERNQVDKVH